MSVRGWPTSLLLVLSLVAACTTPSRRPGRVGEDADTRSGDGGEAGPGSADAAAAEAEAGPLPSREGLARLVRRGEDEAALSMLARLASDNAAAPDLEYLRGRLLERLGRSEEAAFALDVPGRGLPEAIARDARFRRAKLLAEGDRCRDARDLLEPPSALPAASRGEGMTIAARCALALGDLEAAREELEELAAGAASDRWEATYYLAEALAKGGDADGAKAALRSLLAQRPDHRLAAQAEEKLRAMGEEPRWTEQERLVRARRLLRRRRFAEAVAELPEESRPRKRARLVRWLHVKGMALYRSRKSYGEASKVLAEAARIGGPTAIEDAFHSARALSRADRDDEAIAAYRRFVKAHPRHERAADAEFLAAWLEIRHGRADGAKNMRLFLDGPRARISGDRRREAIWHLAFSAYEKGRHRQAAELFGRYSREGRGGLVQGRGLYWQGRALEALDRRPRAAASYRSTICVEPLHWYALLARQRLEALGEEAGDPFCGRRHRSAEGDEIHPGLPLPAEVAFYHSLGLEQDAVASLRRHEKRLRVLAPRSRRAEALASTYLGIGGARRAYLLSLGHRDELRSRPGGGSLWVWRAAYPRPFEELVRQAAADEGVEPAYVYATMRQESGYEPRAHSHAGALGLLQVMPRSGEIHAKRLGIELRPGMLYAPIWNIRLGVSEIAVAMEEVGGSLQLTMAGFNAGVPRVRRWLEETETTELDHFVESIPFDETRGYVRRVSSHYARYRFLEDPTVDWPVTIALDLPRSPPPTGD